MAYTPRRTTNHTLFHRDPAFESFISESAQSTKQLKSLILKRLSLTQKSGIPAFQAKSIQTSKNYTQAWEALNRQLRKILSLLKVLLCEQSSIEIEWKNVSNRNEKRVLECCVAFNQIDNVRNGINQSPSKSGTYSNLLKRIYDNLYSYQSYSQQFKLDLRQLLTVDFDNKKTYHKRNHTFNTRLNEDFQQKILKTNVTSQYQKSQTPKKFSSIHKTPYHKPKKSHYHSTGYGEYVQELQNQIVNLKQQINDLGKDRQQLKEYNILLLESKGVLDSKRRASVTPERNNISPVLQSYSNAGRESEKIGELRKSERSQRLERSKYTERYQKQQKSKGNTTPVGITNFCIKFNTSN